MQDFPSPKQLPLELGSAPAMTRDDLIVGKSIQVAMALIERWPAWQSTMAILVGPKGSGKTHLSSIWAAKSGATSVDPGMLGALDMGTLGANPVLIEDLDAGAFDEKALFHLINAVREAGTSLLISARTPPGEWGIELADLRSRLLSASLVIIEQPDEALLSSVLAKLFSDRQVSVDASVIAYLVNRMERSLAAAADIVDRLDRLALERKVRISRSLAAEVVGDSDPRQEEMEL
jgi:chromosomal replication initiation ATPase DnaA